MLPNVINDYAGEVISVVESLYTFTFTIIGTNYAMSWTVTTISPQQLYTLHPLSLGF